MAEQEKIIMQGICNRVKNPLFVQNGKAMLTDKRFIYLKHGVLKTLAIGALVNITSGEVDFEIPISEISSVEHGKQGLSKTIIINTRQGEKYSFVFAKRMEWEIAFGNILS